MPQSFWLATLPVQRDAMLGHAQDYDPGLRDAIENGHANALAIELIRDDAHPGRLALLVSVADAADLPTRLTCWMAFSNDADWCDGFRRFGVPMIESELRLSDGKLSVDATMFPVRRGVDPVRLGSQHLLTIDDIVLQPDDASVLAEAPHPAYAQFQTAPDSALQTREVQAARVRWEPLRSRLRPLATTPPSSLSVEPAAWPDLARILVGQATGPGRAELQPLRAGRLDDPDGPIEAASLARNPAPAHAPAPAGQPPTPPPPRRRLPAASVFGRPMFHFDDVDLVGFRLTVPNRDMDRLQQLAERLNFHRGRPRAGDDFRWRVATSTIVIELLHYASMKSRSPLAPLIPTDFMSQHELLIRLLVGKVDDDGSQARDASLYIPAIFVNNPWSKVAGRESQGIPKELAEFCLAADAPGTPHRIVGMDGSEAHRGPQALSRVRLVREPPRVGNTADKTLLTLEYPPGMRDDERSFEPVDINAILRSTVFGSSRWRQGDFGEREFRRSFAKQAMREGFDRFRSVQVTPVDDRGLAKAWIHGNFKLKNVRAQFPSGVAVIRLAAQARPPGDPWRTLTELLGTDEISLPTGDWYRLRFSMDLGINDSLDW